MCSDGYWFGEGDVKEMVNGAVRGAEAVAVTGAVASAVPDPGHCTRSP